MNIKLPSVLKILRYFYLSLLLLSFHGSSLVQGVQTIVQSGVSSNLNGIDFADSSTGWIVGDSGVILNSSDGGNSWSAQTSGIVTNLQGVRFLNTSTGLAVGSSGVILRTLNGGTTWTSVTSGITEIIFSVAWANTSTAAWAVGQLGRIRVSTDAGGTWNDGDPGGGAPAQNLNDVYFINASTGWAVGNAGTVIRTYDSGATWTAQVSGSTNNIRGVHFVSISTGWYVDSGGAVFRTSDSGTSWTQTFTTTTILNGVFFSSTDTGRIVGDAGVLTKSTDTGNFFVSDRSTTTIDLNDLYFISDDLGFAVGDSGVIVKDALNTVTSSTSSSGIQEGTLKAINNLFNPNLGQSTLIEFQTQKAGQVVVRIFTMQGRLVRTLLDARRAAGTYTDLNWDGRNSIGEAVASGIYLVHIQAPNLSLSRKIAVVK